MDRIKQIKIFISLAIIIVMLFLISGCITYDDKPSLRYPTPPMNIHEIFSTRQWGVDFPYTEHNAMVIDFVRVFENIHTGTFIFGANYHTADNWWGYDTIILWSDTVLRDFSFVVLNVWDEEDGMKIFTEATPFAIDKLLPTDVIVLNVSFFHYLRPQAAIIFTDESGLQNRMFILQDMSDSCIYYFLWPANPGQIVEWHEICTETYLDSLFSKCEDCGEYYYFRVIWRGECPHCD